MKYRSTGEVRRLRRHFLYRLWRRKPYNRPAGVGNAFPLWWLAPPPFPRKRGHYKAPLCCELLMKGLLFRALFCPRLRGKSGAAGKGEASAASQSAGCVSSYMTHNDNPVTLTLYSSPVRAIPQPSARRAVKLKNPPAVRPVHLKNPFPQPFYTTCRHQAAITLGAKPCQPSHRRCVQWRSRHHNPRPKGPSNLRTLRSSGRSILRTFLFEAKKTPLSGSQSIKGRIVICLWYGRGRGRSCGGNGGGVRFPEWKEVPVPFPGWHRSASGRNGK